MSKQQPSGPSCQPVSASPPQGSAESGSRGVPPLPDQPMPRPAYLYPLPYTPLPAARRAGQLTARKQRNPGLYLALAGFLLGLLSIFFWIVPYLGSIISLLGLTLAILGWRDPRYRWLAIAGCAVSLATLVLGTSLNGYILSH